tara:strand:- start:400 stop:1212 length:813 start_codon:yes stop_codon:yes gene_type:complete
MICFIFNPGNQLYGDSKLGRDKDPRTLSDISKTSLFMKKTTWSILRTPGIRFLSKILYPKSTISYFNIKDNIVAFTIDDGFCGIDNPDGNMINQVRELFSNYDAKATFFINGSHCSNTLHSDVHLLLKDGHEIANHNMYDWPYNEYSKEDFEIDLKETHRILNQYTDDIPRWYRPPHAKLSKTMQQVLDANGYTNIMCDAFANDTAIPDAKWISESILDQVKPGSIVLIHMPEKGVREWNFEAMRLTLEGLKEKGMKIVTVSELNNIQND